MITWFDVPKEGMSPGSKAIIPTGKITITENAEGIDVSTYATADVNVEGGGGSSDFSTAEVTMVNNSGETKTIFDIFAIPVAMTTDFNALDLLTEIANNTTLVVDLIIPKNATEGYIGGVVPPAVATNLVNCTEDDSDIYVTDVTKDASLTITIS